jgi:hypothetical protein
MKPLSAFLLLAASLVSFAYAAHVWDGSYAKLDGEYLIYSGDLGEQAAPTRTDRKASFMLTGGAARDLFESIGPDLKDACGTSSGLRVRQKGHLDCSYDKASRSHVCYVGIDLRTGNSMHGAIC